MRVERHPVTDREAWRQETATGAFKGARKTRAAYPCACGDHVFSCTSQWGVALVSPADRALLENYCWTIDAKPGLTAYAYSPRFVRDTGGGSAYLHQAIIPISAGKETDHGNGNGLDNRRDNLREATKSQNGANARKTRGASQYRGVEFNERCDNPWIARIQVKKQKFYLGGFASEVAAALTYDTAAREHFGEFARLNFPEGRAKCA